MSLAYCCNLKSGVTVEIPLVAISKPANVFLRIKHRVSHAVLPIFVVVRKDNVTMVFVRYDKMVDRMIST